MTTYEKRIAVLTPLQAAAFAKLAQVVIDDLGWARAVDTLDVSTGTLQRLVHSNYLSDKIAPVIMRNYKLYKAQKAHA